MMRTSNISSFYHQTEILYFSTAGKVTSISELIQNLIIKMCIWFLVFTQYFEYMTCVMSSPPVVVAEFRESKHLSVFVKSVTQGKRLWWYQWVLVRLLDILIFGTSKTKS